MATDRRDRTLQACTAPLATAFRRQNQEPCEFKASQSYTVRLEGKEEGGKGRKQGEKNIIIKQAKTQTNQIYPCFFKQTNALFKFSSLPKPLQGRAPKHLR